MRFLFVDQITKLEERRIAGRKTFAPNAPMQYAGGGEISPAAVSEAVGQLVSWLCLRNNDFTARPVFLFADRIAIEGVVRPGDEIRLTAWTEAQEDDQTFVFSGEAHVGDQLVHKVERCHGYYMPLGELEDPVVCRQRFGALVGGGLTLTGDSGPYPFPALAGEAVAETAGEKILMKKVFDAAEPFYQDHFPRFPVTPIVMINEMIGQATQRLVGGQALRPRLVEGIKIRNFVRPGDTVETRVTLKERGIGEGGKPFVVTMAEVVKDDKTILRGRYTYEFV